MKSIGSRRMLLSLALSLLLAACGGGSEAPPATAAAPVTVVSLYAGLLKSSGSANGPVATAQFSAPRGVAQDAAGNTFLIDGAIIRKISAAGVVSTFAGAAAADGFADGAGNDALFRMPSDLVVDAAGTLYVADTGNQVIRKVSPAGVVSTWAGVPGQPGGEDGAPGSGRLEAPLSLALAPDGSLYVAARNAIRRVARDGTLSTFAGKHGWDSASVTGDASGSRFHALSAVAVDGSGHVYAAESSFFASFGPEGSVRKFEPDGAQARFGAAGHRLAVPFPVDIAADAAGSLFVVSNGAVQPSPSVFTPYRSISRISPEGELRLFAGGDEVRSVDGPVLQARFTDPRHLSLGAGGRIVVTETATTAVRTLIDGVVATWAGGLGEGAADGERQAARFNMLAGIAAGPDGALWLADRNNHLVRRIGDDGTVSSRTSPARFPEGIAVSDAGTVVVADRLSTFGRPVFQLLPAGESLSYASGSGQTAAMAFDPTGRLLLADGGQQLVQLAPGRSTRRVVSSGLVPAALAIDGAGRIAFGDGTQVGLVEADGRLRILAGVAEQAGTKDGVGADARFGHTSDVAWDGLGNLYVADGRQLRRVAPDGSVRTVADIAGLPGLPPQAVMTGLALSDGALYATVLNAVVRIAPLP